MASKSATTKNPDATPTTDWRPFRPTTAIWTPRQHQTGVQSALDPQSGRRANTQQASNPPYTPNLDAAIIHDGRPNQQPPRIWTPHQHPTGVHSALQPQSGRRADTQQASNPPYNPNLDAAPTPNRRPNQQPPRIWTRPSP